MKKILTKKVVFNKWFSGLQKMLLMLSGNKERFQKEARELYQNLTEEEKEKKRKKSRERYQNFTEEEKWKSINIVMKNIEIVLKIKSKS